MRRLFAWIAGAAGGIAAYRAMKGAKPQPAAGPDARADELKARLAHARAADGDRVPSEAQVDPAKPADPQDRRAQVHEQARAALEEMRGDEP